MAKLAISRAVRRRPLPSKAHRQGGFSLPEVMVALTVITLISTLVIGALGPWLGLKQSIDNDRRLQDVRQGFVALYEREAMAAERKPAGEFFDFKNSTVDGEGRCLPQLGPFSQLNTLIGDAGAQSAKDGYSNPWCVFVSGQLVQNRDGASVYYRNVAVVSTGPDGKLEPTTAMNMATGRVTYAGDDLGFLVSGYDIQYAKLKETLRRMSRMGNIYETYFSTRYMSYADRDITRYYFSRPPASQASYDNVATSVASTVGSWSPASTALASIGVSPDDAFTAWEAGNGVPNTIEVGNYNETQNGLRVRSPATTGTGTLPYTALLRARIPHPTGEAYVTRVVVGNY